MNSNDSDNFGKFYSIFILRFPVLSFLRIKIFTRYKPPLKFVYPVELHGGDLKLSLDFKIQRRAHDGVLDS